MRRRRREKLLKGLGALLGLCVSGTGCQTTTPHAAPAKPPAVAKAKDDKASRFSGWFTSAKAKAPAPKEPAAVAGGWRPATRPGAAAPAVALGSPSQGISLAGAVEIEPPRAQGNSDRGSDKADTELLPPRLVPVPTWVSPAPRPVEHTLTGPVAGQTPRELFKQPMPAYRVEPPDVLLVEVLAAKFAKDLGDKEKTRIDNLNENQPIRGHHLVRPDGTISLGIWGSVLVAGMTLEEIRHAVAAKVTERVPVDVREVNVDVISYNSKFYYVIFDGGGLGEPVTAIAFNGSDTVLDAIGKTGGIPQVSDKTKMWVARRGPGDQGQILHVDWVGVTQRAGAVTNYQLLPGDRIYVKADHWLKFDAELSKRLSPIERVLGAALLGSETVNSIRGRNTTGQ